mgnify:CR=1 FL=1
MRPEPMEVRLANPRGFCAGVDRAIEIVERALELHGAPVYVLHEIVHNRHVVDDLASRGVKFIDALEEVPPGSVTIFSAHGVSDEVVATATARGLRVIDATCPLVTKVHQQAQRYHAKGRHVILIGHPGHPEVEGTRGRIEGPVTVLSTVAEVNALEVADPDRLARFQREAKAAARLRQRRWRRHVDLVARKPWRCRPGITGENHGRTVGGLENRRQFTCGQRSSPPPAAD